MKQIIKTDNPDIIIERSVIDKEINIKDLEKEILELKNQLNQFNMLEVNEQYPDEIKEIIYEKNHNIELEMVYFETQIKEKEDFLNKIKKS
ncbi:MAG: hypothetical protein WC996_08360 [Peptostreptococcales bacterium]